HGQAPTWKARARSAPVAGPGLSQVFRDGAGGERVLSTRELYARRLEDPSEIHRRSRALLDHRAHVAAHADQASTRKRRRTRRGVGRLETREILRYRCDPPMPTILIVEDNELSRDMLSRRLRRRGYEVLTAIDAEVGLEIAVRDKPNLILMD